MLTPEIKEAEKVAKKFNKPIGIIIAVDPVSGAVEGYSWGTKLSPGGSWQEGCALGGELMNEAIAAIDRMLEGGV
jgi:hypothetical protein